MSDVEAFRKFTKAVQQLTPAQAVRESWESYRTLDPIRAAALQAAVALAPAVVAQGNTVQPGEMVDWANVFEQYLTGEEADGQT